MASVPLVLERLHCQQFLRSRSGNELDDSRKAKYGATQDGKLALLTLIRCLGRVFLQDFKPVLYE